MKRKNCFIVVLLSAFLMAGLASTAGAATLTIEPATQSLAAGSTFTLSIILDDAKDATGTEVAGAAVTLQYDSRVVEFVGGDGEITNSSALGSPVFITAQYDPDPIAGNNPADTAEMRKLMVSGAYVDGTAGNQVEALGDGQKTLFTLQFMVSDSAAVDATATFTLMETTIFNPNAGWFNDSNGNQVYDEGTDPTTPVAVPTLMGIRSGWDADADVTNDFEEVDVTLVDSTSYATATLRVTAEPTCLKGDFDGDGTILLGDAINTYLAFVDPDTKLPDAQCTVDVVEPFDPNGVPNLGDAFAVYSCFVDPANSCGFQK